MVLFTLLGCAATRYAVQRVIPDDPTRDAADNTELATLLGDLHTAESLGGSRARQVVCDTTDAVGALINNGMALNADQAAAVLQAHRKARCKTRPVEALRVSAEGGVAKAGRETATAEDKRWRTPPQVADSGPVWPYEDAAVAMPQDADGVVTLSYISAETAAAIRGIGVNNLAPGPTDDDPGFVSPGVLETSDVANLRRGKGFDYAADALIRSGNGPYWRWSSLYGLEVTRSSPQGPTDPVGVDLYKAYAGEARVFLNHVHCGSSESRVPHGTCTTL